MLNNLENKNYIVKIDNEYILDDYDGAGNWLGVELGIKKYAKLFTSEKKARSYVRRYFPSTYRKHDFKIISD